MESLCKLSCHIIPIFLVRPLFCLTEQNFSFGSSLSPLLETVLAEVLTA